MRRVYNNYDLIFGEAQAGSRREAHAGVLSTQEGWRGTASVIHPLCFKLFWRMAKAALFLVFFPFLNLLAFGSGSCPINLLRADGDANSISITFQNVGKLPIRQLEFDCVPLQEPVQKEQRISCREANALFFPGMEYTVSYPYPKGISERILVSVKSITLSDISGSRPKTIVAES